MKVATDRGGHLVNSYLRKQPNLWYLAGCFLLFCLFGYHVSAGLQQKPGRGSAPLFFIPIGYNIHIDKQRDRFAPPPAVAKERHDRRCKIDASDRRCLCRFTRTEAETRGSASFTTEIMTENAVKSGKEALPRERMRFSTKKTFSA